MKKLNMSLKMSRREAVKMMGLAAGAGLLGCPGGGPSPPDNGGSNGDGGDNGGNGAPTPSILVRPNATSPDGAHMLELYARAVEVMKGRPDTDPTSWRAQARIHLDWCPHGNAYFLPWHRAYLNYFEEIVRDAAEDPSFALPYWDWTTHPSLPDAFWQGSLNDETRRITPGQEILPGFVGPDVIAEIMEISDFETFGSAYVTDECAGGGDEQRAGCGTGRLEGTPHNNVHTSVGGRRQPPPVGNMSTFWSPLDPIFWLHHCNVDRLWATWNLRHANGSNRRWRDWVFQNNFVDAAGQSQSIQVEDTFNTQDLGYRYDSIPAAGPETAVTGGTTTVLAHVETTGTSAARAGSPMSASLNLTEEMLTNLQGVTGGAAPESAGERSVRLTVGGFHHPAAAVPISVFVGPEEIPGDKSNPSHVGTFSFFPIGEGSHDHGGGGTFLFDIGEALSPDSGFDPSGPIHVHVLPESLEDSTAAAPEGAESPEFTPSLIRIEILEHV